MVAEGPRRTLVTLEHRDLERFGEATDAIKKSFESPEGWGGILERYATVAAG